MAATTAARIAGVNRNAVNSYYARIKDLIFERSLKEAGCEFGEFEHDELHIGARRVRLELSRGVAGKSSVLGLLKRGEKVYIRGARTTRGKV